MRPPCRRHAPQGGTALPSLFSSSPPSVLWVLSVSCGPVVQDFLFVLRSFQPRWRRVFSLTSCAARPGCLGPQSAHYLMQGFLPFGRRAVRRPSAAKCPVGKNKLAKATADCYWAEGAKRGARGTHIAFTARSHLGRSRRRPDNSWHFFCSAAGWLLMAVMYCSLLFCTSTSAWRS